VTGRRRTDRRAVARCAAGECGSSTWRARTSRGPRCVRCLGKARPGTACDTDAEAARHARRRGAERSWLEIVSQCPCLNVKISKNLNRSAQSGEYESCRSHYPLQLLQRLYGVFLHGFWTNCYQTLNATLFR
jgi:hypothetical protein